MTSIFSKNVTETADAFSVRKLLSVLFWSLPPHILQA